MERWSKRCRPVNRNSGGTAVGYNMAAGPLILLSFNYVASTANAVRSRKLLSVQYLLRVPWSISRTTDVFIPLSQDQTNSFQNSDGDSNCNDNPISGTENNWLNTATKIACRCRDWGRLSMVFKTIINSISLGMILLPISLVTVEYTPSTCVSSLFTGCAYLWRQCGKFRFESRNNRRELTEFANDCRSSITNYGANRWSTWDIE